MVTKRKFVYLILFWRCFWKTIFAGLTIPISLNKTEPVNVEIGIYIESIGGLEPQRMAFDADIYFRQSWSDWRLNHSDEMKVINDENELKSIWRPDLYFKNARKAYFHEVIMPNFVLFIDSDGTVWYSTRISLTVSCHMQLHRYPMDTQICKLKIGSYAFTSDKMNVSWFEKSPIIKNPNIDMPEFTIVEIKPSYCTGLFSCLEAKIYLHRSIGYHLLQTFMPTALIVLMSFVSFWIDRAAVPARITLCITTLLAVTTQAVGIRITLPPVSYAKAIDFWLGICLLFVFAVLLEYAAVNSMMLASARFGEKFKANQKLKKKSKQNRIYPLLENDDQLQVEMENYANLGQIYSLRALKMDKISRFVFPAVFSTFVFVYWVYYCVL